MYSDGCSIEILEGTWMQPSMREQGSTCWCDGSQSKKGLCRQCVFPEQLSGVKYQSTAWWVNALWKQLEPNYLEGRRGPSGLFDSCPRASFGTPCKYSSFVYRHLGTSAEEKGTDNRGKAVVGKLSTVCEQCPQVSHERTNKGGGEIILQSWMVSFNLQTSLCDSFFNAARVYQRLTPKSQ